MKICETCHREFDDPSLERCPDDGGRLFVVGADSLIGQTLDGRFVVDALIAAGGMGRVYLAHQTSVDRSVALKILKPELAENPLDMTRFFREAKTASKLNHPNAITVYDFGQTDAGQLYLAMELVDGVPLRERLCEREPLSVAAALEIAIQLCHALEAAHQLGITHRDLKPENIMLCEKPGYTNFVKVLDFGLAKLRYGDESPVRTGSGVICGTPMYLSPEQAQGLELDGRSDLYSLGVILYELLSGRPPFEGPNASMLLIQQIQDDPPELRSPDIPPSLKRIVMQCLSKDPDKRPQSAAALRERLAGVAVPGPDPRDDEALDDTQSHEDLDVASAETLGWTISSAPSLARPAGGSRRLVIWLLLALAAAGALVYLVSRVLGGSPPTAPSQASTPGPLSVAHDASDGSIRGDLPPEPDARHTTQPDPAPRTPRDARLRGRDAMAPGRDAMAPGRDAMAPGRDAASPRSDVLVKETSDHVVIQLETTPPGAQVFDQRKPLGRTPLTLRRRRSDQPLQVRFTLTGFERLRVAVSQNQSQRLHYTLSKRKRQDSIFRPLER